MTYTTLISTADLAACYSNPNWAVIDCRFSLADPTQGRRDYLNAHIPGAVYAHLDDDLSGPIIPGETGRHPLPSVEKFAATLSRWGIDAGVQVVAYDDAGGMYAARLWWMLRWLGHADAAVLDGGWLKWWEEARPMAGGLEQRSPRTFYPDPQPDMQVSSADVLAALDDGRVLLADARDAVRYRGEAAGLDPVAGRIPGALSAHYVCNLNDDGTWRSPEELRAYYAALLGADDSGQISQEVIFYCGSGVTAAHDVLALEQAGLGDSKLYAGSWSEWITDATRPVARG
ncbi:MAG: sulfurtransferase [Caldilineaceae bacterium]|nr:sulfurtransferase [Caldilineaceae bacterium]